MQIDREKQAEVNLKISARDGGTNPKYATAQVKITIEDENDIFECFNCLAILSSIVFAMIVNPLLNPIEIFMNYIYLILL